MHKREMVARLPRRGTIKALLVVAVLIWVVANWPQQSAAFVEQLFHSLGVFVATLKAGGH